MLDMLMILITLGLGMLSQVAWPSEGDQSTVERVKIVFHHVVGMP